MSEPYSYRSVDATSTGPLSKDRGAATFRMMLISWSEFLYRSDKALFSSNGSYHPDPGLEPGRFSDADVSNMINRQYRIM